MLKILLWIWQIPQHILAGILYVFFKLTKKVISTDKDKDNVFVTINAPGIGVSLGRYIFLNKAYDDTTRKHEKGHTKQSIFLGPLYLIIVGIPSAVFNNLWDRLFHKKWSNADRIKWYYNRFPESWADKLGGVTRNF